MKLAITREKLNTFLNNFYRPLAWAMAALVLIAGALFLIWPQYTQLQTRGILEHQDATNLLEQRSSYLLQIKNMKAAYGQLSFHAWQDLAYILPKENEIFLLFAQLESLAKENNITISSINISGQEAASSVTPVTAAVAATEASVNSLALPPNVKTVGINVNVDGLDSYEKFKKFLDNIESNIRLLDMSSLNYSPDASSYTFTFNTYYLKEESAPTAAAAASAAAATAGSSEEFYAPPEE